MHERKKKNILKKEKCEKAHIFPAENSHSLVKNKTHKFDQNVWALVMGDALFVLLVSLSF